MSTGIEVFRCGVLGRPAIYEPWGGTTPLPATFGLRTLRDHVPPHLREYVRLTAGLATLGGERNRPVVVAKTGSRVALNTVLQCARDANLSLDDLLTDTEVEVAVRPYSFTNAHAARRGTDDRVCRRLCVMAVCVDPEAMTRRFDELCARYFTGG